MVILFRKTVGILLEGGSQYAILYEQCFVLNFLSFDIHAFFPLSFSE